MALIAPVAFSPNREYLAFSSPDGTLKLWETATGLLKQEYTPSSHLSATCSCISWSDLRRPHSETPRKKKKRKSSVGEAVVSLDLIALGTTSGPILLYSVVKGDLQTQLTAGHTDVVHGVCWHPDGDTLYSCSADQHIVEWCLSTATVKRKWAADKSSVNSITLCHTGAHLLSAGRKIKLWDLDTQQVLKTFTGHVTEVFRLLPVSLCENCMMNGGAGEGRTLDGSYFVSAALSDRLINVWQVSLSSKNKNALGAFSLTEEPIHMHLDSPRQEGQPFWLIVVTKGGEVLIFEHTLNGRLKKPVKPKVVLRLATESNSDSTPKPISVLSASIDDDGDRKVLLAHGNFLRPTFERVAINSTEKEMCLIRTDPNKTVLHTQGSISKVKTPVVSQDVTILAPGHLAPSGPTRAEGGDVKGKKRRKSTDLSMEERLNAISIGSSSAPARQKEPPRADTLATLLTQGLQSKDKQILNSVLQHSNETLIRNTVRRLPLPVIVPLTQELTGRMYGQSRSGHTLVKWIKLVLTIHTSYLMTFPELVGTLGTLYEMMDSRVELFSRFSRLQGKLDLILSQVTSQSADDDEAGPSSQAMLVYQDESSEEDPVEDIVPDHSESEDNWEEDDMEVANQSDDADNDDDDDDEADDDSAEASDSNSDNEDNMLDGD